MYKNTSDLTRVHARVWWIITHDGEANENSWIALSNNPVFNNNL